MHVSINGHNFTFNSEMTILQACKSVHIFIPTLCYHEDLPASGRCGLCSVRINGNSFAHSCMTMIKDGMSIETNSIDVIEKARKSFDSFLDMSQPPSAPDIEAITAYLYPKHVVRTRAPDKSDSIVFSPQFCVNCMRCIRMCNDVQTIGALNEPNPRMKYNECISCGQCITVCPTQALQAVSSTQKILRALGSGKTLILQIAPAVRATIAECFGAPIGTVVTGKLISAAKIMGFKYIFDTCFGADVTIIEEGNEFIKRLQENSVLPQFTSCCPAWVNYIERHHSELMKHLSSVKSPHMIVGSLIKTYFAQKSKINPDNMFVVSLMPCVAKKNEIKRMHLINDVDAVITTVEFADLMKDFNIDLLTLRNSSFDSMLGDSTGAANIFGTTGGVAEACARYATEVLTGKPLQKKDIEFTQLRGYNNIKTAELQLNNRAIKFAVCNGVAAAKDLIESGKFMNYHFIEVMACSCGCIAGGGQPKLRSKILAQQRGKGLYSIDETKTNRVSSENPEIKQLYETFLSYPGSQKAVELLHTFYEPQETSILVRRKRMQTMPIVAYGSSSGTAMRQARLIAGFMGCTSVPMNNIRVNQLIQRKLAIFVISTIGDGESPINCRKFFNEIEESMDLLNSVQFAVFAIGSTDYKHFCQAGISLQNLLEMHQASSILPLTKCNTSSSDRGESVFEKWCFDLCSKLDLPPPKIGVRLFYSLVQDDDPSIINTPLRPLTFEITLVKSRHLLTSENSQNKMFFFTIKLPQGFFYDVGDEVEILPENPPELVDSVIMALKLNPNCVYSVQSNIQLQDSYIPQKVTIKQLFSQYLDLCGLPNRSILRAFLQVANSEGQHFIEELLDVQHEEKINAFLKDISCAELIFQFVKFGIPTIDLIVSSFPHIKPRIYSIASSPRMFRNTLDLVVSDKWFGGEDGKQKRHGLATSFLSRPNLLKIAMKNHSRGYVPSNKPHPIIFVANGPGIACIFGMFQNLERSECRGSSILFYEARSESEIGPLMDKVQGYIDKKILNEVFYGFTEEGKNAPQNIHSILESHLKEIFDLWVDPSAELIYSGAAGSIPYDIKKIMLKACISQGGLAMEEADAVNERHKFSIFAFN